MTLLVACSPSAAATTSAAGQSANPRPTDEEVRYITLGDIDPDDPIKKIERFQPLADYLAERLGDFGITGGRVVIARDIEEMAGFLQDGTVDIYFDSPFATLQVQDMIGSEIILRRWKEGVASYWSTLVTPVDSDIADVMDLESRVVVFEDPLSTSGFILPAGMLIQAGFSIREVASLDAQVADGEVGYFFSRDEDNTFGAIARGLADVGGVSNEDFDDLDEEVREGLLPAEATASLGAFRESIDLVGIE